MSMPPVRCSVRPIAHYLDKIAHPRQVPPVWVVIPIPHPLQPAHETVVWGLGRRILYLPDGSAICPTWREAMQYATTGRQYRPVANVYPEWCGV